MADRCLTDFWWRLLEALKRERASESDYFKLILVVEIERWSFTDERLSSS
jgi:hypothetical protein